MSFPMISAHRGGSDLTPEPGPGQPDDALLQYKRAIEIGVELVEFDVRRTKDDLLVRVHDNEIEGLGPVSDIDYSQACLKPGLAGSVPRIEQILELAAGKAVCHIDLKTTGDERRVVELARTMLGQDGFWITSLEPESIARVRREFPQVHALLSLGRDMKGKPAVETLRRRAAEVFPLRALRSCDATGVAVEWRLATPWLLRHARRAGLKVMVWTVNSDQQLRRFLDNRFVDVVVTDRPMAAQSIRDSLRYRSDGGTACPAPDPAH